MAVDILPAMTYFAILLGVGVIITNLTERIRIPNALFLLLVGLLFGPTVLGWVDVARMGDIPTFLRTLALIVIVFAASFNLKLSTLKRVSKTALKLSFGGFIFTTALMGIFAHELLGMSPISAILTGAIIGGTSSAAVYTFRSALKKEQSILDLLTVESIFSDPLTVLTPMLILGAVATGVFEGTVMISKFWQMIAAGVGAGVVIGLVTAEIFQKMQKKLSPTLSFAIAMVTYAGASNIGGSGILAVAICAMILGNQNIPHKELIGEFEDSLSIILTISIFTLLGAQVALNIPKALFIKELIFVGILIFVARPLFSLAALLKEKMTRGERLLIAFTGPRGAAAAAMAAIPLTYALEQDIAFLSKDGNLILVTAFLAILFTMISGTIASAIFKAVSTEESSEKKRGGVAEEVAEDVKEALKGLVKEKEETTD